MTALSGHLPDFNPVGFHARPGMIPAFLKELIMPNWCSNHTTVQGDPALISELTTKVIKPDPLAHGELMFDFKGIFPTPESLHLPEGSEWGRLRKRKIKHAKPVAAAVAA